MTTENFDLHQGWNSLAAELLYSTMVGGPPKNELSFYERKIRANGGIALDQACGTGRHLFPLIKKGLEVNGADISADALQFAKKVAKENNVNTTFYHQSMEDCDIPCRYGTIFVANGTFQILSDRKLVFSTLHRFLNHLTPGGELLLELFIPDEAKNHHSDNGASSPKKWNPIPLRDKKGKVHTTLWSESVDLFEQILLSKRRYDLYLNDQCIKSEVHSHLLRWFFQYEFIMMLERVGFEDITTYSDHTDKPASQDSEFIVYGARRPKK